MCLAFAFLYRHAATGVAVNLSDAMQIFQIFVSSTCYDLLDLRSEIEGFLSDKGVTPIMSDSAKSGFEVLADQNSIKSCLANVERSDAVIVILCRRYGPKLGSVGFDDVSATHFEYREAVTVNRYLRFAERDRG